MIYAFGDYELDTQLYELRHAGQPCALEPQVFNVLAYLIEHRDRVVSKDDLIAHVWPEPFVNDATLHQRLTAARRAVGDSGRTQHVIKTLRGRGYRFIVAVQERQAAPEPLLSPATSSPLLHALPGERKIVTVLSGTLANTTALAECLGLEALPGLQQRFLSLAQDNVQRYEGTFQPVGEEGFQALFGMPLAQEDHARRAILAALALQGRLRTPYADCDMENEVRFTARLGAHTGTVMVGGNTADAPRPATVVGEVITVADQLQHRAEPGMVLVSEDTLHLLPQEVHTERLGAIPVPEQTAPLMAYTVRGLGPWRAPIRRHHTSPLTRFVGRERELTTLHASLKQVEHGQGQVVGVMGEPGMGKSRLLYEFVQSLTDQPVTYLEGHCLSYGSATPYLPVLDLLRQRCGIVDPDSPETLTANIDQCLTDVGMTPAESAPYLHQLLGLSEGIEPLASLSPQTIKNRTFATLHQLSLRSSQQQPLVMAIENLHWIDPTSEEWLLGLVEQIAHAPLLLITTYRPGYRPLWMDKSYATQLALARLTPEDSRVVVQSVAPSDPLPAPLLQAILSKAGGNPFFLEELTRAVAERGEYQATLQVPDSVQAVLAARLDRLPAAEKRLLQIASVIGKDVPVALLQVMADVPKSVLDHHLKHLQTAEFLYELQSMPHHSYTFRHALTQEVAYQSLLTLTRQQLHVQIAQVLAERFPETVGTQPERLAYHYTEGGRHEQAISYWHRAGKRANERSAYVEATTHLTTGLEVLNTLPETPERLQHELALQTALGLALIALKGQAAPEVGHTYARARELCQQVGETPQLFPVLQGLWRFYIGRAAYQTARELAEQFLHLAQRKQDPALLVAADYMLQATLYHMGEFVPAQAHMERGLALYDPEKHHSHTSLYDQAPGIAGLAYASLILWLLGYPDQSLERSHEALAYAQEMSHPHTLVRALVFATRLHQFRREAHVVQEYAETVITLATEQGFVLWLAGGITMRGWALSAQGQGTEGRAQIQQGLSTYPSIGIKLWRPYVLALLAEAYGYTGQTEEGVDTLAEALAVLHNTGEFWWKAELYRLKGEFLQKAALTAEACFHQALSIARQQHAKSLELRAATSLARLWQSQDKRQEAYDLLAPVYEWFTEGFDTADLQDAKVLLETLGRSADPPT